MRLPAELLANIIDFADRPTLIRFSKANKQCRALCLPHRYRKISLPSQDYEQYLDQLLPHAHYIRELEFVWYKCFDTASLLSIRFPHPDDMSIRGTPLIVPFTPLFAFIKKLPNLADIYWSINQFLPPDILTHLEYIGCRMHLTQFQPFLGDTDHEYLMRSPSLYGIGTSGYVPVQTMLHSVAVSASLRELYIGPYPLHIPELHHLRPTPPRRAQLTTLNLRCCGVLDLAKWLDYSTLRILNLNRLTEAECKAMVDCAFPSLRQLTINDCEKDFLEKFVPKLRLTELELRTVTDRVLGIILDSTRETMEAFRCVNTFVDEQWLRKHLIQCRRLESVGIGIKRSQGSDGGIYESLSELPLRGIHLVISSATYAKTGLNTAHRGPLPDEMNLAFNTLRDLALDETLARALFRAISHHSTLQMLTLRTSWPALYSGNFTLTDLALLTWVVTQHWRCRIDDRAADGYTVKHLDKQDPFLLAAQPEVLKRAAEGKLAPVLYQLWPESAERRLDEVWHSFPIFEDPRPVYVDAE